MSSMSISSSSGRLPTSCGLWTFSSIFLWFKLFIRNNRCNALFNKREKKAATTHASGQVYTQVLNKAIEDTQRKAKAHTVLEFNRHDIQFLV
ncbi:hypothetical protein JHK86_049971 [Glycine max]|nr:hypothetical protein JHK86_049971 [Glycine max]